MTRSFVLIGRAMMHPRLKLARDLGMLWIGQIGTKGVAFLAFAILARRLLPEEYGAVEYAMGLATLATLAIDGGLGSVGVRRLTQGHQSAEELVALIPAAQLCLALVIAPAMVVFTWLYTDDANALKLTCLVALSLFIPPWKQDWLFQAKGMMTQVVLAQCVRVISFMLGCVLLVRGDADVVWVGFAEILSVLLATGYLMSVQHRKVAPLRLRFALHKLADLLREGAAIGLGAICWALFQYAPLLILAAMAGMTDTAYFGAAHRLGVSLVTFSWLYHFNLYPVISRRVQGEPAALASLTRMSVRACAWGGIGLALALALMAEPLLRLLFGAGFERASMPFSMLIWTFPLTLLSGHARWILIAAKRGNDMLVSQIAGVCAAIPMAYLLIGPLGFGATGAAAAMSIACAVVWAVSQYYTHKRGHDVPFLPALPAMIAAAMILLGARQLTLDPMTATAIGMGLFLAAAFAFDHHLIAEVRQLIKGDAPRSPDPTPHPHQPAPDGAQN
ncbi:oligosaccharide flippase family protein [Sphingobium fluviale]|uniref:Lipopolysaccharide biosynthesis protein n=1 Tax=Sphingobium fluviale TaxID=2506423 RepID=A0A4Q1KFN6_9SPHN|nr:lipopolysaccharide biosynthesis protein [Sphingobium fluviale]RXR26568.1 lipopolysaccharide biosynthesis protein [Sphingobium fluviale]